MSVCASLWSGLVRVIEHEMFPYAAGLALLAGMAVLAARPASTIVKRLRELDKTQDSVNHSGLSLTLPFSASNGVGSVTGVGLVTEESEEKEKASKTPTNTVRIAGIHLIMGPMFSGKTSELKRRIDVKRIAAHAQNKRCLLIKYKHDTRYGGEHVLATHNKVQDTDCIGVVSLDDVDVGDYNFIFVDEGQFFKDMAKHALKWAFAGKEVTVAALDATAFQELWPEITALLPYCIRVKKLNAVCRGCGASASLTIRHEPRGVTPPLSGRDTTSGKAEITIGGGDIYKASCLGCAGASLRGKANDHSCILANREANSKSA